MAAETDAAELGDMFRLRGDTSRFRTVLDCPDCPDCPDGPIAVSDIDEGLDLRG